MIELSAVYQAFNQRDTRALERAIQPLDGADVFFNPMSPDVPNPNMAGSLVGLCASAQWHDGLRVCSDAGMSPNRNSMVRDPMAWAFINDDATTLSLLNCMQTNPLRLRPDDRHHGINYRPIRLLTDKDITRCMGDSYGELDYIYLDNILRSSGTFFDLRPLFGVIALNQIRTNSHLFFDILTQSKEVRGDAECRYFAQFAYFNARNEHRDDIMNILLNNLGLEPDEQLVWGRISNCHKGEQ